MQTDGKQWESGIGPGRWPQNNRLNLRPTDAYEWRAKCPHAEFDCNSSSASLPSNLGSSSHEAYILHGTCRRHFPLHQRTSRRRLDIAHFSYPSDELRARTQDLALRYLGRGVRRWKRDRRRKLCLESHLFQVFHCQGESNLETASFPISCGFSL